MDAKIETHVKSFVVTNELGFHVRPATVFVKIVRKYNVDTMLTANNVTVNGRSLMELLLLAALKGARISVSISGEQAEQAMAEITEFFESGLGEG